MRRGSRRQKRHHGESWERIQVKHARARFGERYGEHLSEEQYWAAVGACRRQQACGAGGAPARLLYEQSRRKRWYLVTILGRPAIAIFDARLDRIVTFYAPAALSDIGLSPAAVGIGEVA